MSTTCYVRKADGTLLGPMQREAVEMMKAAGMLPDDCCILDEKAQEKASSYSRLLACVHQDDIAGFIALLKEGVSPAEKGPDGFSIAELVRNENKTLFINCLDLLNLRHEQKEPASVCAVAPKVSVADCSRIISDKQKELIQCTEQCLYDADSTQEMKIRQLTEELLASGWNVNSELSNPGDPTTFMIFHVALKMGNVSFVDRLLQSGAKVTPHPNGTYVVNPLGYTLYTLTRMYRADRRDQRRSSCSLGADFVKKLIAQGAVLEDSYGLQLVSEEDYPAPELLELLLELPSVRKDDEKFTFWSCKDTYLFTMTREAAGMLAARGWNQTNLLLHAVRCGWEDLVRAFIANGADVNALGRDSHTSPLQEAVSAGHIEVVKILLQNGADWTAVDAEWWEEWLYEDDWCYPDVKQYLVEFMSKGLFQAIEEDDAATFERLINSGADVYVLNERGENTLQVAQRLKNKRIERMIRMICDAERRPIESGSARSLEERTAIARIKDILLYGKSGNESNCLSLIHHIEELRDVELEDIYRSAAEKNYATLIKELIVKERKEHDSKAVREGTLKLPAVSCWLGLFAAARTGSVEACESLLEGAEYNDFSINSAMETAIFCGHPQVFRCLWNLTFHEKVILVDMEKLIFLAIRDDQPEILDMILSYKGWSNINPRPDCYIHSGVLRMLLKGCVNLPINELCSFNKIGKSERLPLCIAADEGDDECVRLLLDAGAKVALRGVMGRTALHYAAYRASARKVQDLIHAGAEVNVEDERGYTPLHLAALVGDEACTRLLLEAGANANAGTLDGFTALHFAANQGRADIAELLLRHGAERNPVNGLGISALSLAEKAGYDALVRLLA